MHEAQPEAPAPGFQFGVERYSSPDQDCLPVLLKHVGRAQQELLLIVYGFTLAPLAALLVARAEAGVRVRCIMDRTQAGGTAQRAIVAQLLAHPAIDLVIGHSPAGGIIHEKAICVDRVRLLQGSYNFSPSAQRQENHLDVFHSPENGVQFAALFARLYTAVAAQPQPLSAVRPAGPVKGPSHE